MGGQAPGKVIGTVSEFCVVPAWLGKAIEAMDLTADPVDTVSIALGKFLYSCVALLPGALREAGAPKRERREGSGLRRGLGRQAGWCTPHAASWCGTNRWRSQADPRFTWDLPCASCDPEQGTFFLELQFKHLQDVD